MAYIGNQVQTVPFITDTFSGNASTVNFTLTRAPAGTASIAVFISGLYQPPTTYSLVGDVISFVSPPGIGTNNIVVLHIGNGSATQVPSDGSVTTITIADGAVTAAKLASGVLPTAHSNSAFDHANSAFASANSANATDTTQNNSITAAFTRANSASNTANSAFAAANAATATDTTQNNSITAAFTVANSASNTATAAFASSNTKANIASPSFTGFVGMGGKTGTVALDVNGAIYGNTIIRNTDGGSALVPSIQPGNDNDTGMFLGGTNIIGFSTGGIERLEIDASGTVILANGLSIGRTAVTGTPAATDGNVFSGTYTPTLTNSSGLNSSTASACHYVRVGNVVIVSGQVQLAGNESPVNMRMTLPIASAFTANLHASGHYTANGSPAGGTICADIAGDRFLFLQNAGLDPLAATYIFTATYQVL